jgi:hypothetical protein
MPSPFELHTIFSLPDPLAGITSADVDPETAELLALPNPPLGEWADPERLADTLPDVMPFDLDLMPESLRPLVRDAAERMQVPVDLPAITSIATLAGVTNRRAVIQPKLNDHTWVVVPNLWGGIVASPWELVHTFPTPDPSGMFCTW